MRPYFYLGGNRGLTQLATGEFFYVNTEDRSITPWILYGGYWELFVDDILCALARPGGVFVDVGANMGYYTIKIGARLGPDGMVYSFEPNPETFGFLYDNVMMNAFESRSTLLKQAVGAEAGETWFSFQRREPGGGAVHEEHRGDENEIRVPVVCLDDAIPADRTVDLIKIDVEGFEPQALKGMQGLLARCPEAAVVVELSYDQWARFGDPITLLQEAAVGRDIYRIHHTGHIQPLPKDNPASVLEKGFVSYMLLLPPSAERQRQVAKFLSADPDRDVRPISPQLSRRNRLVSRLMDLIKGR
jgi:FkbM family methyltransferase